MEKEERLAVPKFLQELTTKDFAKCYDGELITLAIYTKVIVSVYDKQERLLPFERTMVNGFIHYLEKIECELKKRGILIVDASELIVGHEADIVEVLKEFSLQYLVRLVDELEEMTKSLHKHDPFLVLKRLVYEEIARRSGSGGMV